MKSCPHCLSQIPDAAEVCCACGHLVAGKRCPACVELVRDAAGVCRHCGHSFARDRNIAALEAFCAVAARFPTWFMRGRLIPQEIHLSAEKILITTWGYFKLSRIDEEIPWQKVAGHHYHSGLFWDSIEIQTRGQKAVSITCLPKAGARHVKEVLERMKE